MVVGEPTDESQEIGPLLRCVARQLDQNGTTMTVAGYTVTLVKDAAV